ncbi:hypothetical protein DFH07DRAFT_735972 [Mycena maculata]|uniref:Arrestin-like N-terminal domain-containing protein n=1 Tax=Mycena maculata TaxID=230809 RepID=A0AAD7NPF9_9AGAR|nr:hypothetical protein DFH07DRAFT_735972 [Mycena maculata]
MSLLPIYNLREEAVTTALTATSALGNVAPSFNTSQSLDPKEYPYEIRNSWGKPWATLTLLAHPRLSRTTPTFLQGSSIAGSVKLSLSNRERIECIAIIVRGKLVTWDESESERRVSFWRLREVLWEMDMGDPRSSRGTDAGGRWGDKLHGEYRWEFSIKIPELLDAQPSDGERPRRLPHSFTERFSIPKITYEVKLRLNRGRFRPDDRLIVPFAYFTMQQPGPPSPMRQLAYQNNTDIPGPHLDSDGWHALEPVQIRGAIFGERAVDAKCTVFLAKPLCYTRSTSIPCAMAIETEDPQAADLLASIKSSTVYLQQCVSYTLGRSSTEITPCGQASWWPAKDAAALLRNPLQRHLMGKVQLRKDLQPSSTIKQFQVEYEIVVFPFGAVAFKPESSSPLATHGVEIVTCFAPGPRPRVPTNPVYEPNDAFVDKYYSSQPKRLPRIII